MDELTIPDPCPEISRPAGDVDDLIFSENSDWFVSER